MNAIYEMSRIASQADVLGASSLRNPQPGGKGYLTNFYTGKLRPEVQPLTLLYTIFQGKGTPFVDLLFTNGTPFTYLV